MPTIEADGFVFSCLDGFQNRFHLLRLFYHAYLLLGMNIDVIALEGGIAGNDFNLAYFHILQN